MGGPGVGRGAAGAAARGWVGGVVAEGGSGGWGMEERAGGRAAGCR